MAGFRMVKCIFCKTAIRTDNPHKGFNFCAACFNKPPIIRYYSR